MQNFFSQFLTLNFLFGTIIAGILINWVSTAIKPGRIARWALDKWAARSQKALAEHNELLAALLQSERLRAKTKLAMEQQRFEAIILLGVTIGLCVLFSAELLFEHVDMRDVIPAMSVDAYVLWGFVLASAAATTRTSFSALYKYLLLKETMPESD